MSSEHITALTERLGDLEREVARLNRRLNVALDLIGECRVTGYPESLGIVEERLERAEQAEHFSAGADEDTAKRRAAPPTVPSMPAARMTETEPSLDPPPGAASMPLASERPKWEPFVPGEAPLAQQKHAHDYQTEHDRKAQKAIEVMDGLGKLKK